MGKKVQHSKSSKLPNKSKQTNKIKKDSKSSKKSERRVTKAPKKYVSDERSPSRSPSPIPKSKKNQKKPAVKEVKEVVDDQSENNSKSFKPKPNKNPSDFPSSTVELSNILQNVIKELKARASFNNIHQHLVANYKSVDTHAVNKVLGNLENQGVIVPPSNRTNHYTVYQGLDEKPNTVIDIESEGAHNEAAQEAIKPAAENEEPLIQLENQGEPHASDPVEESKPEKEEKHEKALEENSNDIEVVMDNNNEDGKKTGAKSTEKGSTKKDSARKSSRKSTKKSASKSAIKEPADYDLDELADN